MLRRQLPVVSPLSLAALVGASWDALRGRRAPGSLRHALEAELSADTAVLCGSGTQALQLAIELARERAGGTATVALPAFACFSVAAAAVGARAPVLLYEVDPDTLAPDPLSLEAACVAGARVIVVVHFFGLPVDWDDVSACARRHGALLIEDAAQGQGARWRDRPLGSLAPLSVLRFGRGKGWTGGAGGALLLRGPAADWALATHFGPATGAVRLMLATAAQWALGRPSLYGIPAALPWLGLGETRYEEPRPVRGLPEFAAALLLRLRKTADEEAEARRAAAEAWRAALGGAPGWRTIRVVPGAQPGYLRFPLRLAGGLAGLRSSALAARLGVAAVYPHALGRLPALRPLLAGGGDVPCPSADALSRELVTLPTHSRVQPQERAAILVLLAEGQLRHPASPTALEPSATIATAH